MVQRYDNHNHEAHDDPNLLKRISGISAINAVVGTGELDAGFITGSSTLTMAGIHDIADGGLYATKRIAAEEKDTAHKRTLRRRGAMALVGAAFIFGSYEIASNIAEDNHKPEAAAAYVGVIAAGANIAAASILHGKKHHADAHDSWRHVAHVDLPASAVTLVCAPLAVKYPALDSVGAGIHMLLSARLGKQTFDSTK